jgi:hypothetical protein
MRSARRQPALLRIAADDIKARGIALAAADIDGDFDCG